MGVANAQMNLPKMQQTVMEFQKQQEVSEMKQEYVK